MRGDDVARSLAQLLHGGAGAGRVVLDVLAQLHQVSPGLVPAVLRIHRVLVAEDIGQPLQEGASRPGVRRARIEEPLGVRLRPVQQLLRGLGRHLHRVGHVLDDRAARAEHHAYRLVLGQALHLPRTRQVDVLQLRQLRAVVSDQRHPQLLIDAGGQPVGAGQHKVDIDTPCRLLCLQLARQLRRRRLREGDLRHQLRVRLGERLHRPLRELQLSGHVDHIECHRGGRQRRRRGGPRTARAKRGKTGNAAKQRPAVNDCPDHDRFSWVSTSPSRAPGT